MLALTRSVRFCVNPAGAGDPDAADPANNGYAAVPGMLGLGAFYELHITCHGHPHPQIGYLLDIKVIDRAARATIIPHIANALRSHPGTAPASVLAHGMPALAGAIANGAQTPGPHAPSPTPNPNPVAVALLSVRWQLTPHYSIEVHMNQTSSSTPHALLRQRFEIAAAHRLHIPTLSDEANAALFGKCNNPSGHGHNYIIEPAVRVPVNHDHNPFTLAHLERIVQRTIIEPFDHKHLNNDTPEFSQAATPGHSTPGVNPSVENISMVFYKKLAPAIAAASQGATLHTITVYETEKTSSTYPA